MQRRTVAALAGLALTLGIAAPAHAGTDHLISCEVYPGRTYDVNIGGWRIQTTGTGECTDRPDYLKSTLYLKHWSGFGWDTYGVPSTAVNPGVKWFQKVTSSSCREGFYRSFMVVHAVEDGDAIDFSHWGPTAHINCGVGEPVD